MYAMNWTSWGIAVTFTFLVAWTLPDMLRNARNLWYDWEAREQTIATRKASLRRYPIMAPQAKRHKMIDIVVTGIDRTHSPDCAHCNALIEEARIMDADGSWMTARVEQEILRAGRPNDIQDAGYKWRIQVDHPSAYAPIAHRGEIWVDGEPLR